MTEPWQAIIYGGLIIAGSSPLPAQDFFLLDTTKTRPSFRMSEIVVYGERPSSSAAMHEVNPTLMDDLIARDARQYLEFAPGIYFSKTFRNEYSFRIRGIEQRQIQVFWDGVPVSVPYNGVVDVSQFLGAQLNKIRLTRGVSSSLYGANTLGGSVNFITHPPRQQPNLRMQLEASQYAQMFGSIHASGGWEHLRFNGYTAVHQSTGMRLSHAFTPTRNEEGGIRDNSEFQKRNFGLKTHYIPNQLHTIGFHLNLMDNSYGVPPNAISSYPRYWKFPKWQKGLMSLNSEHLLHPRISLRTVWYYDRYHNILNSYDDDTYSTQTRPYAFHSEWNDASFGTILYPKLELFTFGSTDGMVSIKQDIHREANNYEPYDTYSISTYSLAVDQDIVPTSQMKVTLGLNLNYLQLGSAEDLPLRDPLLYLNGQVRFVYDWTAAFSTHIGMGRKSRFPTLKELYSSRLGRNIPNPHLESEHAFNTEMGMRWSNENTTLQATLFWNTLTDLISDVYMEEGRSQLQNISSAEIGGLELHWRYEVPVCVLLLNYTYLTAVNTSLNRTSQHLEYRPSHSIRSFLRIFLSQQVQGGIEMQFASGQYYQNPDSGQWERLPDIFLLDVFFRYQFFEALEWYVKAENVFDGNFMSEYGVPISGREIRSGLQVTL